MDYGHPNVPPSGETRQADATAGDVAFFTAGIGNAALDPSQNLSGHSLEDSVFDAPAPRETFEDTSQNAYGFRPYQAVPVATSEEAHSGSETHPAPEPIPRPAVPEFISQAPTPELGVIIPTDPAAPLAPAPTPSNTSPSLPTPPSATTPAPSTESAPTSSTDPVHTVDAIADQIKTGATPLAEAYAAAIAAREHASEGHTTGGAA